jgi:hypothetical protein
MSTEPILALPAAEGRYSSASEYLRNLVGDAEKRKAKHCWIRCCYGAIHSQYTRIGAGSGRWRTME